MSDGELDAVVVAAAGLARLGRLDAAAEILDPGQMLPAPGQGALAVECRADDDDAASTSSAVARRPGHARPVDGRTHAARRARGRCTAPVGALADVAVGDDGDEIYLRAVVASTDGSAAFDCPLPVPFKIPKGSAVALRRTCSMQAPRA